MTGGDFDNDGIDEIGLHRESTGLVYFRFTHTPGPADSPDHPNHPDHPDHPAPAAALGQAGQLVDGRGRQAGLLREAAEERGVAAHVHHAEIGRGADAQRAREPPDQVAKRAVPGEIAAVVGLSGFVVPADGDPFFNDEAVKSLKPAVFWGRDQEDQVITPDKIEYSHAWLNEHVDLTKVLYANIGHGINAQELAHVKEFLTYKVLNAK